MKLHNVFTHSVTSQQVYMTEWHYHDYTCCHNHSNIATVMSTTPITMSYYFIWQVSPRFAKCLSSFKSKGSGCWTIHHEMLYLISEDWLYDHGFNIPFPSHLCWTNYLNVDGLIFNNSCVEQKCIVCTNTTTHMKELHFLAMELSSLKIISNQYVDPKHYIIDPISKFQRLVQLLPIGDQYVFGG